jgi:hypothetical protein
MGAGNVKAVYARWGELPHVPFRALAYMALVSLDKDRPPRYWGGREDLASAALGRKIPDRDDGDPNVSRERRAAFRAVDRAVRHLTETGAIEVAESARNYRRATYTLHLERRRTTVNVVLQDHAERGPEDHAERVPQDHAERGAQDHAERGAPGRGSEGGLGLTSGEMGRGDLQPDRGAHTREPAALRTVPTDGIRDPLPAVAGVPGQRAMLLAVAAPPHPGGNLEGQDHEGEVPYGRCEGCGRPFARPPKEACPNCGLVIEIGDVS